MDIPSLTPAVSLVVGILILIFPRLLNILVAAWLIFTGAVQLWPALTSGALG